MKLPLKIQENKFSAIKVLASIIYNGLLVNPMVSGLFILIFLCLSISCYYELHANLVFENFVSIKNKSINTGSCTTYIRYYILHMIFGWLHNFLFYAYSQFMKSLIYHYLLKKYLKLSFYDFSTIGTGKIHSFINKQADSTIFFLSNIVLTLFYTVFYLILFYIEIFQQKKISLFTKYLFVGLFVTIMILIISTCFVSFKHKSLLLKSEHTSSHALLDILRNFTIVKAFNRENLELKKFKNQMKSQIDLGFNFYRFETLFNLMFKLLMFSAITAVVLAKYYSNLEFLGVETDFFVFFGKFLSFKKQVNGLKDSILRINDKFVESVTCDIITTESSTSATEISGENAEIMFANTSIYFDSITIFEDLNIQITPGLKIAVTGRNGVGKSTIMKALMGMHDYQGDISINGIQVSEINEKSLRDFISYVPQEPNLFNTTVMDNLKYGKDISDEEVYKKCEDCGVHAMIKGLENGYLTVVGENCQNISGGQAQIINFMRAYIKDAPIFLLDEPTSALDYSTSNKLMDMVFDHLKHKTVFLTTHNPKHLDRFDKVINISSRKAIVYDSPVSFLRDQSFEFKM